MKISELIKQQIIYVTENTPLKEAARLIFSLGIGALPVVKQKRLVGILTGHDILSKMYPTAQEIIEDFAHAHDFEAMEKKLHDLLEMSVVTIMNRKVTTVTLQTTIMHAQSLMLLHRFSHLPIINSEKELVGIVSQGDIFRHLMKNQMPRLGKERYVGFIAMNYDSMVNWNQRFAYEYPTLSQIFKKENVKSVIDLGVWTGEYAIQLAKKGPYQIIGLDHNPVMIKICQEKKDRLSPTLKKRVSFILSNFTHLSDSINYKSDAAICMGNALSYIDMPLNKLFCEVVSVLRENNPILIIQLLNYEKIIKTKKRLLSFKIEKSKKTGLKGQLSLEFFDKNRRGQLLHHVVVFDSDGKNWLFKGTTTIPIKHITRSDIEGALKKAGFGRIIYSGNQGEYQGRYGRLTFDQPFDPQESDWLNVLAKK